MVYKMMYLQLIRNVYLEGNNGTNTSSAVNIEQTLINSAQKLETVVNAYEHPDWNHFKKAKQQQIMSDLDGAKKDFHLNFENYKLNSLQRDVKEYRSKVSFFSDRFIKNGYNKFIPVLLGAIALYGLAASFSHTHKIKESV